MRSLQRLGTTFPRIRFAISLPFVLMYLIVSVAPSHAKIGDVLETFDNSFGSNWYWAFDETLGRYHGFSGGYLVLYTRNGSLIKSTIISSQFSTEIANSGGRGMAVPGTDTWMLLARDSITKWQLGEDAGGDLTLTRLNTIDLKPHLPNSGYAQRFGVASDGTIWLSASIWPDPPRYVHLSADGSTELGRLTASSLSRIVGISDMEPLWNELAVEQLTGNLLIGFHTRTQADRWVYYIDPSVPSLLGRFKLDFLPIDHWVGANGSLLLKRSGPKTVRISIEEEVLPEVLEVRYYPEGVFWNACDAPGDYDQSYSIRGRWGTSGPAGFILSPQRLSGWSLNEQSVLNGEWIDVTYETYFLHQEMTYMPAGYWVKQLHLINGDNQISEMITLPLNIGTYHGGVLGSPQLFPGGAVLNCDMWTRNIESGFSGSVAAWNAGVVAPVEPLEGTISFAEWVPWLGGKTFGVEDLQAAAEVTFKSKGQGFASLSGGGRILVGSGFIGVKLGGGAKTELTTAGLVYPEGQAIIDISGGVKEEAGLLRVFPVLEAFKALPIIGRVFIYLDKRAQAMAEIRVEMLARPRPVSLPGTGDSTLAGDLAGALVLTAALNVNIWRGTATGSVLGEARAQLNYSSNETTTYTLQFQDFTLQGLLGYNLVFWGSKWVGQEVLSVKYTKDGGFQSPPQRAPQLMSLGVEYTHGSLDPTKQREVPQPHIITANPFETFERFGPGDGSPRKQEIPVVGGLANDASPFTAFGKGGTMMVVWQQEVAGRPPMQATDIYYSYFNGAGFSPPAPISADTHGDFHPKVAYHHSGVWVAIWERVNRPDLPTTGDPVADAQAQISELIPAVSVFDPATGNWSAPQHLDTEGTCYLPKLATGPTHDITAFWLKHPDHELFPRAFLSTDPTTQTTNALHYCRFTGPGFETPQPVTWSYPLASVADYDAADNGTEVRVAASGISLYELDSDHFAAAAPLQVYARSHSSPGTGFTRLTRQWTTALSLGPQLVAMGDGTWRVAWKQYQNQSWQKPYYKNDPVIRMTDDFTSLGLDNADILYQDPSLRKSTIELPLSDPGRYGADHLDEFVLGDAGNGQVFLVFKDIIDSEPNMRLVFDDAAGSPSAAGALLTDSAMEKAAGVAAGPRGELFVTYYKGDLVRTTQTVDIDGVPTDLVAISEAPAGTLTFLQHTVTRDLTVGAVSLRGGALKPGTTLTLAVDVESLGALSVQDPSVTIFARQFYPPASPGEDLFEIASDIPVVTGVMPGFAKETVEVQWVFPAGIFLVYAMVDPNERINEDDEQNNIGPTTVFGIDYPANRAGRWRHYR